MGNTITGIIPTFYNALNTINRELVGFIPAVRMDSDLARVAVGQTITYPVVAAKTGGDTTPAMAIPSAVYETVGYRTMTMTKSRFFSFSWQGEEQLALGSLKNRVLQDDAAECVRGIVNEIESDLAALHVQACRAYGTATTAPFASTLEDSAQMLKLFEDNGAPTGNLRGVVSTTAALNLRKQAQLTQVNTAGTDAVVRRGALLQLHNINWGVSAAIKRPASGTGANVKTDATGYAVGSTTIGLESATITGTGTIVAGDIITFAGDTNKYVVKTGDADTSDSGSIVLEKPGLRVAIPAAETAITISAISARNMVFDSNAIVLGVRAPARPDGGDMAIDVTTIQDPISGLVLELALYPGYRMNTVHVSAAWGCDVVKPENLMVLMGE